MWHCSTVISPLGNQSATENYPGVGHAVDRFIDAMDRRFSCSPCSIATVGVTSKLGVPGEKLIKKEYGSKP